MSQTNSTENNELIQSPFASMEPFDDYKYRTGLWDITQLSGDKFLILQELKKKRKKEEKENLKLKNKVSLLQKEEQRVLNKIISIGMLKNKINEVKKINENFKTELQRKQKEENKELESKKQRIQNQKDSLSNNKPHKLNDCQSTNKVVFREHVKEKELFRSKKQKEQKDNKNKVRQISMNWKTNHSLTFQVYKFEKELLLRERIDAQRTDEIEKYKNYKISNKALKKLKIKETEILGNKQLIQDKLFEELKEVILSN